MPHIPAGLRRAALAALAAVALMGLAPDAARAGDGSWTQVDGWAGGVQWVTNIERGRWVYGMAGGYDDGQSWARAAILRTWQLGPPDAPAPWKLRAGLALRLEEEARWDVPDDADSDCLRSDPDRCAVFDAGLRLAADRWSEHGDWGLFLMGEYTSIDNALLGVAGLTHLPSGWGGQMSLWHEDGGEVTPSVMVSKSVTPRLSLRLGHKFVEGETFLGVSFSTY